MSPPFRVVSYDSALEVYPGEIASLPACTQRTVRCGAVERAAWMRWLSVVTSAAAEKHCFMLGSTEARSQTQNLSDFQSTQKTGLTASRDNLRPHQFSFSRLNRTAARLPARVADVFCSPEDPDAVGDDSSSFVVTQQQWRLACALPPTSLDPRLAFGAFAVAKDENRDRFIGDRRPLNRRERSTGRAHLPYCPRHRRTFLPVRSSSVT